MLGSVIGLRGCVAGYRDRQRRGRDRERAVFYLYSIVRVARRFRSNRDRVFVHILAGFAAQAVDRGYAVGRYARHRRGQRGIGTCIVVVDLRLVFRLDRDLRGRDDQFTHVRDDIVVTRRRVVPPDIVTVRSRAHAGAMTGYSDRERLVLHQNDFGLHVVRQYRFNAVKHGFTVCRQHLAVINLFGTAGRYCDVQLCSGQRTVDLGDAGVEVCYVFSVCVSDDVSVIDDVGRGACVEAVASAGRFHGKAIGQAIPRYRTRQDQIVAVVGPCLGRRDQRTGRLVDGQNTEFFFGDPIVALKRVLIEFDLVGVIARADHRLCAGRRDGHLFIFFEAFHFRYIVRQRRSVIVLIGRTGNDLQRSRIDEQATFTDEEGDVVVVRARDAVDDVPNSGFGKGISVVAGILFFDQPALTPLVVDVRTAGIQVGNIIPDIIHDLVAESLVAYEDVILRGLSGVGEACHVFLTRILVALTGILIRCITVGLDADGHVDFGHREGAADVAEQVVVIRGVLSADHGVFGRYLGGARVQAARLAVRGFAVGIVVSDGADAVARQQPVNADLVVQFLGQAQQRAVVGLVRAHGGDSRLLLIEEGEYQIAFLHGSIIDGIGGRGFGIAVGGALDRLVERPAGNRRAGQREGIADLHVLRVPVRDRVAVHVDKVDRDVHVLEL